DCLHIAAVSLHRKQRARAHRDPVHMHRTRAALTGVTADVGTGQPQVVAEEFGKRPTRLDLRCEPFAIDGKVDGDLRHSHAPAARKACQTERGVNGSSILRTPRCHSASTIALPIAAGGPMVPVSLPPLTPSGLLGAGVQI